ncbi:hypothetical protein L9F63_007128, partial [Diploptera punctata]
TSFTEKKLTMLKATWAKEINRRALGFSYDRPQQFVRSQWQRAEGVSIVYLVYRWMFAVFFFTVLIYSIYRISLDPSDKYPLAKWPIYLTHWGYTMCTVQAILAAGLVTQRYIKERATGFIEDHAHMPRIYKTYWLLHSMAVVIAIGITGSYFVVDYNPAVHVITALNLLVHAFNSILMVLDIIIVSHPFRLLHFIYSFIFIIVYFVFTAIYYLLGGTGRGSAPSIYPALDWRKVDTTFPIATLGALSVILAHFCIWLVVLARKRLARAIKESKEEVKISKSSHNQVLPINETLP